MPEKNYDERPWGNYKVLHRGDGIWVKRIEVKPESRLSLQRHEHRIETWFIIKGKGFAIINDEQIPVTDKSIVHIPSKAIHRMCNFGTEPLVFIEIASGDILTEEDIIRLEDDYGRK